jgi:dipeptidase D
MNKLTDLEPKNVWQFFNEICKVPRPSGKEDRIIKLLFAFAEAYNLEVKKDDAGNVLISKSASKGMENHPLIVLQSHLDMVCEKNEGTVHDFEKDPIKPYIDGEWVRARGTTLGADCGIGIAAQLAVLSSDLITHGPLECLFTVDEERGLTGAKALKSGFFQSKTLINLDSEDEGQLFIGCAGGIDTVAHFKYKPVEAPEGFLPVKISVTGLQGGHSGDDIEKGRGNAIKILVRFLWHISQKTVIHLASIKGGNLRNAIPREAFAEVLIPFVKREEISIDFNIFRSQIENELLYTDPNIKLSLETIEKKDFVLDHHTQSNLLNSLYACPNGILSMSFRMPGMVETSTNLASVRMTEGNQIEITTSQRSDLESGRNNAASMIEAIFQMASAKVTHGEGYPGWTPDPNSEVLKKTVEVYKKLFGAAPVVRSIHAGLECGLFLEKFPGLDMISFGPTLRGVHSPDEKIHIGSVQKFWQLLTHLLAIL